mmetsp:Transcript_2671/g.3875  ORF Transcript_2671/g.3875 Transcript_2671/m.3875 type:complete len:131 (-) Transcript_2671:384-776(-)
MDQKILQQAKKWLTFLPSAAFSESVWSFLGNCFTKQRNRTDIRNMSGMVSLSYFYKCNAKYFNKHVIPRITTYPTSHNTTTASTSSSSTTTSSSRSNSNVIPVYQLVQDEFDTRKRKNSHRHTRRTRQKR